MSFVRPFEGPGRPMSIEGVHPPGRVIAVPGHPHPGRSWRSPLDEGKISMKPFEFPPTFRKEDAHGPVVRTGCPCVKLYGSGGRPQWPPAAVCGSGGNARIMIDLVRSIRRPRHLFLGKGKHSAWLNEELAPRCITTWTIRQVNRARESTEASPPVCARRGSRGSEPEWGPLGSWAFEPESALPPCLPLHTRLEARGMPPEGSPVFTRVDPGSCVARG